MHYFFNYGKPQTISLDCMGAISLIEFVKDVLLHLLCHANSVVRNGNNGIVSGGFQHNLNLSIL